MNCERPPLRFEIARKKLAERDDTGTSGASSTTFALYGLDPRLRVAVAVYFQPRSGQTAIPASGNTWQAQAAAEDGVGSLQTLGSIFNGRALPDGWEFSSAAEPVLFTASLSCPNNEQGTWWAVAWGKPSYPIPDEVLLSLYKALRLDVTATPLKLKFP